MKLYFLRHGIAEDISKSGLDRDRRLTDQGVEEMELEAEGLKRLNLNLDLLLTSPYARAFRTAEIVAKRLGLKDQLQTEQMLAPGFSLGNLQKMGRDFEDARNVMLVGHNFDFPHVAGQLCGGAEIDLKKGGLIRVDVDVFEPGQGTLEWVLTPKILLAMAER